jgi:hypothetical protein
MMVRSSAGAGTENVETTETLFRMVEGDESRKKVPPSTLHRNHHDEIILIMMVAAAH